MEYPLLSLWVQDMPNTDRIENRFKRVFDDKGELLDTASPKLASLRNTIIKTRDKIKNVFKLSYTTRIIRSISKKRLLHSVTIAM